MKCPHCNGTGEIGGAGAMAAMQKATVLAFEQACKKRGWQITGDGMVSEYAAAVLIGKSKASLRRWRDIGCPHGSLPWSKRAGKVFYSLSDLALWCLENGET